MVLVDRLAKVEYNLGLLYEQLDEKERAVITAAPGEKVRVEQSIRIELLPRISQLEAEYIRLIGRNIREVDFSEGRSAEFVADLAEDLQSLEIKPASSDAEEGISKILSILEEPATPAAAKLKLAIPIVPGLVSYEIEGDTETLVRRLFPTFVSLVQYISKK